MGRLRRYIGPRTRAEQEAADAQRERTRRWYNANKEYSKERAHTWYMEHRASVLARTAEWWSQHPEHQQRKNKRWSDNNPERKRELSQSFRQRHRDRIVEAKDALGGQCWRCGTTDYRILQFDHMIPDEKVANISRMGGCSDDDFFEEVAKCRLLCANCHQLKTLFSEDADVAGEYLFIE